jgi:predicted Zn-dependent protease
MTYRLSFRFTLPFLFFIVFSQSAVAGLIRDTELETGLQELAAPLVKAAGFAPNSIDFRIIIDSSYNAFVAGKMAVYLHSGLLLDAKSPEEILGVIAHELGHIRAGHVPRRDEAIRDASNAGTLVALAAIALAAGGAPSDAVVGVAIGGNDRARRSMLQSFRHDEAVADELGLEYLEKAGITSAGLEQMMRRLASQRALPESHQSHYYQTHPDAAQRLAIYQDHAKQTSHRTAPIAEDKRRLMERLVNKLRAYCEPAQNIIGHSDDPGAASTQYRNAIAHYRRGDLELAYKLMNGLSETMPDDPFYHEFRGDILLSMAKPDAAAVAYEKALALHPNSPQIQLNLGRSLIATNNESHLPRAIEAMLEAKKNEPDWAFIHRQLAIAYGRAGHIANANLSLAEEAILLGNEQQAARMAKRALASADLARDVRNRANDILFRFGKSLQK